MHSCFLDFKAVEIDLLGVSKTMKSMLKNLGLALGRRNGRSSLPTPDGEKNFCSPEQFQQRLAMEKRRAERLNTKSSVIVLHLKKNLADQKNKDAFVRKALAHLARMICTIIRETDAVSLYQSDTILILLPDTSNEGAQKVCGKLAKRAEKNWPQHAQAPKIGFNDLEMQILSYPEKSWEYSPAEIGKDPKKEENNGARKNGTAFLNSHDAGIKKNYIDHLNLCVTSLNGSTLAVPIVNAFLWEPLFAKDFFTAAAKALKKTLDCLGAIAGLILFSPAIVLISVLIKLTSSGPVLFKQKRLGHKGKPFMFLKFRSMYIDSEDGIHQEYVKKLIRGKNNDINNGSQESPFYKIKSDPRVTPVGKFIRKTSLDELPQLWNVLKGDMSLVGPRPPILYEVKEYQNWHYRRVLEAKPGITGLWQVTGRNTTTFDEMVRLDIYYAQNWSLALDFKIIAGTIRAILKADGQ